MSMQRVCPVDGEVFDNDDFCPTHGRPLVLRSAPGTDSEASASPPAAVEDLPATERGADDGSENEKQRRLRDFIRRLRPVKPRALDQRPSDGNPRGRADILPAELQERGWHAAGPVFSRPGIDTWPIASTTETGPTQARFHRYRSGSLTTSETYDHLMKSKPDCLPHVLAHGTVDFGGARADYDVTAASVAGMPLEQWMGGSAPSEARALELLPTLARLLTELKTERLMAVILEPSLLRLTAAGRLVLDAAHAVSAAPTTDGGAPVERFRPTFAHSLLLPDPWAAPELRQLNLLSANAAVFSVGQILATATWGQPLTIEELQLGSAPFRSIVDVRLARALMGCLWPSSRGRWTQADLLHAVTAAPEDLPAVSAWASRAPGASCKAFPFAGQSFWRLEDLVVTVTTSAHWQEAKARVSPLLDWAETTNWAGHAAMLKRELQRGRSPEWVLVSLARTVCPDLPVSWRRLALDDEDAEDTCIALAQQALQGDEESRTLIRDLFEADLRGAFTGVPMVSTRRTDEAKE